jgi:hypothetical protein
MNVPVPHGGAVDMPIELAFDSQLSNLAQTQDGHRPRLEPRRRQGRSVKLTGG